MKTSSIAHKVLQGYSNASNHAANGIGHLLVNFEKEQDVNKLISGLQELRERAMKTAYFIDNGFKSWLDLEAFYLTSPWDEVCPDHNFDESNAELAEKLANRNPSGNLAEQVQDCVADARKNVTHSPKPTPFPNRYLI